MYLLTWLLSVTLMNQHTRIENFSSVASALNNKQSIRKKNATHNFPRSLNPQKENQLKVKMTFLADAALGKITESIARRNPQQYSGCV